MKGFASFAKHRSGFASLNLVQGPQSLTGRWFAKAYKGASTQTHLHHKQAPYLLTQRVCCLPSPSCARLLIVTFP